MSIQTSSLKTLAEDKTVEGITKATSFRVDPDLVTFEPGFNLREENDELELHIDRLANAMLGGAYIPPVDVSVKDGVLIARDGHCRTRAAQRVKKTMPEFTLECRHLRGNEQDAVLHMLGTGSGQKPLTPLEQGRGYLRLIRMGMTPVQIAEKLGVSRVTVDNGLVLAEAPVEVQQMVAAGEVSSTTAREVVKQGTAAVEALKQTVEAERQNPSTTGNGKKSKKKKVTAKKLRGTAADKSKKKKNKKKAKGNETPAPDAATPGTPEAATPAPAAAPVAPKEDEMTFVIKKSTAKAVAEFLKANAPDEDAELKHFAAELETAMM